MFLNVEEHILVSYPAYSWIKRGRGSEISWHLLFEWLAFWSLTPSPSPNGEGCDYRGYPSFAACVLISMCLYSDVSLANHQHLTTNTQHPPLAVTFCDICMPEAFCEFKTVRKWVLLNLWVLWEKKLPSDSKRCSLSHRRTQMNRFHKGAQRH